MNSKNDPTGAALLWDVFFQKCAFLDIFPLFRYNALNKILRSVSMKHRTLAGLICAIFALFLCSCSQTPGETLPDSTGSFTTETPLTAAEQYANACRAIGEAEHLLLTYSFSETRSINGASYTKSAAGTATYQNIHQDSMTAVVEETLKYGAYENTYEELYCDKSAYALVGNCIFSTDLSVSAFVDRQIPAVLMDGALYESIVAEPSEAGTLFTFSQPTQLERWLSPGETATLVSASGSATLDSGGSLTQSAYRATCLYQGVEYVYEITVKVSAPKALDLSGRHPTHFQDTAPISDIRIPKLLLQIVGDVYSSETLCCEAKESIDCEAISVSQDRLGVYELSGTGAALNAKMAYTFTLSDYRGDVSTSTQEHLYQNGEFTVSLNGGEPALQPQISPQTVRQSCEDAILSALFATKYIQSATLQEEDGHYRMELSGNDTFTADMMVGITQFLQVDLEQLSDSALTNEAAGYVVIDSTTGLPTAMGLSLNRQHIINTVPYQLTYRLEHSLVLSGMAQ